MAVLISVLYKNSDKRILYAEAGKEFVDLLLSLLSLPLGYVMNLLSQHSSMDGIGSIASLYQSAARVEESVLYVKKKELINQKPSKPLSLLPSSGDPKAALQFQSYLCDSCLTVYAMLPNSSQKKRCACGGTFNRELKSVDQAADKPSATKKQGYVKKSSKFIISDDLTITPSSTIKSIDLLNSLNVHTMSDLASMELSVGQNEVVDIVKACLTSKTVLNDVFKSKLKAVRRTA